MDSPPESDLTWQHDRVLGDCAKFLHDQLCVIISHSDRRHSSQGNVDLMKFRLSSHAKVLLHLDHTHVLEEHAKPRSQCVLTPRPSVRHLSFLSKCR
jgi:hypothetical protein